MNYQNEGDYNIQNNKSQIKLHKKLTTKIVTLLLRLPQKHIRNYL